MSGAYTLWRLPQLCAMVSEESDAATVAHMQAWEQKHHLLVTQKLRLESLIAELSTHWNPGSSEASLAFVNQLTEIVRTLDYASLVTARIWGGLGHITNAISDVRKNLQALQMQYYDSHAATSEFYRRAFPQLPESFVPTSAPGLDGTMLRMHQDRLDKQARLLMTAADDRVLEAAEMFEPIPTMSRIDEGNDAEPGGSTVQSRRAGGPTGTPHVPTPIFDPPPPTSGAELHENTPILAGSPPNSPPLARMDPPALGALPEAPGAQLGVHNRLRAYQTDQALRTGTFDRPPSPDGGTRVQNRTPAALPFPGVIGGTPAPTSTARTSATNPRRSVTDPGVVSPPGGRTASDGRTTGGGWHDRSFGQYVERRSSHRKGDPDSQWIAGEGVPPVIEAANPTIEHDPGPGVIGLDR